jgi:hypothetical protein
MVSEPLSGSLVPLQLMLLIQLKGMLVLMIPPLWILKWVNERSGAENRQRWAHHLSMY